MKRIFPFVSLALAISPVMAADETEPESIVVTASRLDQSAANLSQSIELISSDDFREARAIAALCLVRQHLESTGGN
jgi:outer membrane cobalamin receptor